MRITGVWAHFYIRTVSVRTEWFCHSAESIITSWNMHVFHVFGGLWLMVYTWTIVHKHISDECLDLFNDSKWANCNKLGLYSYGPLKYILLCHLHLHKHHWRNVSMRTQRIHIHMAALKCSSPCEPCNSRTAKNLLTNCSHSSASVAREPAAYARFWLCVG